MRCTDVTQLRLNILRSSSLFSSCVRKFMYSTLHVLDIEVRQTSQKRFHMYERSRSSMFREKTLVFFCIRIKKPKVHYSVTLKVHSHQHLKRPNFTTKSFLMDSLQSLDLLEGVS